MRLLKAEITGFHTLELTWSDPIPFVGINIPGYTITNIEKTDDTYMKYKVEVHEEIEIHKVINVLWNDQKLVAENTKIAETKEFAEKYQYAGPLGVEIVNGLTTFRLWAPTALKVNLQLYSDENPSTQVAQIYAMTRNPDGVWALTLTGDTEGLVYDYGLIFPTGKVQNSYDPYAKACIVNGRRSVVLSNETLNPEFVKMQVIDNGLDHDSEVLMLHCHVKTLTDDISSGLHERLRGKYLGLLEPGTKTKDGEPTGFDYIKQYKPTHLRLMPIADFGSVDEKTQDHYSLGDDQININIPEGSYASDPFNPVNRIIEAKKMIDGLHQRKIKVILDMMYSKLLNASQHALELCVPGYFLRKTTSGKLTNEIASEKYMARRYIIDSVKYWLEEYHIDGICFKSINALDLLTVKKIREIADEIDPNIIIMGEMSGTKVSLAQENQASLSNADQLFGVNFINRSLQSWLENYPNVDLEDSQKLMANMLGEFYDFQNINMISPDQIVQTLQFYAKPQTVTNETAWFKFILSIYFLSQGAISIDVIEIMLRRNVEELEAINWNKLQMLKDVQVYLKKLIKFRYTHPIFALAHYADIRQKQHQINLKDGLIAYSLKDQEITYTIIINTTDQKRSLSIPTGTYDVLIDRGEIFDFPHSLDIYDDIQVLPLNILVLSSK